MTEPDERPVDHRQLLERAMADPGNPDPRAPQPPAIDELAPHFPDHEILGLIGRGGMGAVYKARQHKLDRLVAIKVLQPELASDPEFGERFLREARALASLNHPHVLTVHDFGKSDAFCFLITEYVDGVNLRQLMELGELSPAEALRIAPQVCEALQYAHEHGVVHRDIKPENILVDTCGQVKIADFGLAKLVQDGDPIALTRSTAVFGTPQYMAPEQWRGSSTVDHRADIYSLGVVLYEMLTGQLPIGNFDPPSQRSGVPRGLDEVVRRTLAQQPENRYQHAREVQTDVELQARSLPRQQAGRRPVDGQRLSKIPFAALGLVVAGAAAMLALVFVVERQQRSEARYRAAIARYERTAEAMIESARQGESWTGQLEELPVPPAEPALSLDGARILVVGIAPSILLLAAVLGFWSLRRIRNSEGRLGGLPLAVFTAWMVPLGLVNGLLFTPIASLRGHDTQMLMGFFAAVLIGAGDIWFLVRETRRQRALLDSGISQRGGAGFLVTGAVTAFLLLGGAVTAALLVPGAESQADVGGAPTRPRDLLGRSRAFVLERLGPPLAIQASAAGQVWSYLDATTATISDALTFSGRKVLAYDGEVAVLVPNERPSTGPHVGQDVADLVAEIGPPIERIVGTIAAVLEFSDGLRVTVHDGVVIGIERD